MRWSKEEEEFLTENWGNLSIKAIAKKLNRSENAIEVRIRNRLLKEYGIKAEVTYELKPSANLYPAGELRITYRPDPLDFKLRMEEDHKYTSL